jgi:hypothetical protein
MRRIGALLHERFWASENLDAFVALRSGRWLQKYHNE